MSTIMVGDKYIIKPCAVPHHYGPQHCMTMVFFIAESEIKVIRCTYIGLHAISPPASNCTPKKKDDRVEQHHTKTTPDTGSSKMKTPTYMSTMIKHSLDRSNIILNYDNGNQKIEQKAHDRHRFLAQHSVGASWCRMNII